MLNTVAIMFMYILFCSFVNIESARILAVYPCPSISHQIVFRPMTLELIKRGHQVTVVTADPIFPKGGAPENLTEIDMHDMSYKLFGDHFNAAVSGRKSDLINQMKIIFDITSITIEEQFKTNEFQRIIKNQTESFDLILIESIYLPALGLTHIFKAPTILVSSFGPYIGSYEIMGAPTYPVLYHNMLRQRLYNLTLLEKISELYNQFMINYYLTCKESNDDVMLKRIFGPDTPSLNILKDSVDMLIVNIHPVWEGNYPVPPNVIHTGRLHLKPEKKLPKDLQQYLDSSENGVIYFSFGTNVKPSLLPPEKIAIFDNVFSQLPYNVIWKWDNDDLPMKSSNIKVLKWLPQADLLRHRNVKLFITQGGLQSTDEAIAAGVPLIGFPMLVDQWYNVEKYVYHEIGLSLEFEYLTEDRLKNAILQVVEDKRYRNNVARLRSFIEDQPQSPLERAIWWIEYVLRHRGAKHLRAPAANISWSEYLQIDLIVFFITSLFITLGSIVLVIRYLLSCILRKLMPLEKIKKM